jgi:hypothetical protein
MKDDQTSSTGVGVSSSKEGYNPRKEGISLDGLHRLLAQERRRLVLSYLATHPRETVSVDDITDMVAGCETPRPGPAPQWEWIAIDLYHVHLPTLADAGVIEYDPVAETVQYTGSEELRTLLATDDAEWGGE